MRVLIQRVANASVYVGETCHGAIGNGMLIFLGVRGGDTDSSAEYLASRCAQLRIFEDNDGKMNLSLKDTGREALVVSQCTLYGDTRKGNRPSFTDAAPPALAEQVYNKFLLHLKDLLGESKVASGVFRAMMSVHLVNDGPVTLLLDSKES